MRKYIRFFTLIVAMLIVMVAMPVSASEIDDSEFSFSLTVDGKNTKEVNCGDIITVCLRLRKHGQAESYTMYAMQDELRYDSRVLELVEGSEMLYSGISTSDIEKSDRYRELYLNFLSLSGGTTWDQDTVIGTVQFRVIGTSGVTTIKNSDYLVSFQDGSGSYPCKCDDVTIIISTDCTVRFHVNGGTSIENQIVQYGEKISCPAEPERDGYQFEGWYTDITLTEAWDFEMDLVKENMSLYAKWTPKTQAIPTEEEQHSIYLIMAIGILVILLFLWIRKKRRYTE